MNDEPRAARVPHLRIHAVTVPVADQDRSRDFFVDRLGFRLVGERQEPRRERP